MNAVDLIVEDEAWNGVEGKSVLAEKAIAAAFDLIEAPKPGVVAILLTGDDEIARLNRTFRDKDGPTNVLSFPSGETADNQLGDMALAWGVMTREAEARGITVADHLRHLIIHGFLHLQGYDHQHDDEAERMEDLERRALVRLGVADPYAG